MHVHLAAVRHDRVALESVDVNHSDGHLLAGPQTRRCGFRRTAIARRRANRSRGAPRSRVGHPENPDVTLPGWLATRPTRSVPNFRPLRRPVATPPRRTPTCPGFPDPEGALNGS